jgi:hypothetical protein
MRTRTVYKKWKITLKNSTGHFIDVRKAANQSLLADGAICFTEFIISESMYISTFPEV